MTSNGNGRLRQILEAAAGEACLPLSDLTVLDKKVDPYRQDTPAGHRDGAWLAEQMARHGRRADPPARPALRAGVEHQPDRPDGARYLNDADCWGGSRSRRPRPPVGSATCRSIRSSTRATTRP